MRLAVAVWIAAAPLLLEGAEGSALAQGPWNLDELRKPPEVTWLKREPAAAPAPRG